MKNIKLALLGGDRRLAALAGYFSKNGVEVACFGISGEYLPGGANVVSNLKDAFDGASAVILPLPISGDGVHLSCPLMKKGNVPEIREIFKLSSDVPMYGGRLSPQIRKLAEEFHVTITDYFDLEELKIRNSVLASEGALSIAMNRLDVSVFGSKSAVIGYGRLGKTLAPMLKSLGSRVTVAARKSTDLAWAAAYGFETLKIGYSEEKRSTLTALCRGYDVIFNTAPHWLFNEDVLRFFSSKTIIVDLASAPGGVDPEAAQKHGIEVIPALSLPGKYAPVSAGELIGEYLFEILTKELNL